jgi:hypothetical protein
MAISKKGMRPISVNNEKYHWKFTGKIFVSPDMGSNDLLIIDFGWYDFFDYVGSQIDKRPPDFEPKIATPRFVAKSIKYARNTGWKKGKLEVQYRNGIYSIK